MRRILVISMLLANLSLVGCSTNTQTENTVIGALGGAVVGGLAENGITRGNGHGLGVAAGIVVGGVVGALIGHYIDSTDHSTNYPILADNPYTKEPICDNPQTHVRYNLTPKSNVYTLHGNTNCRDFHFSSTNLRKKKEFDGTACLNFAGHWEQVSRS